MDWSNEMVIEFLHNYEDEPIIWDPQNPNNKKKHLVNDAWYRIKSNISWECEVEDLKKKRDSLMAYYRAHLNKIKKQQESTSDEVYKINWFAFNTMHNFLGRVYNMKTMDNFEEIYIKGDTENSPQTIEIRRPKNKNRQEVRHVVAAKKQMDEAFTLIKDRINSSKCIEKPNECEIYGQLLAQKLMRLDEDDRLTVMNSIDNLVFQTTMQAKAKSRLSTASSSTPSVNSTAYTETSSSPDQMPSPSYNMA